MNKKSEKMLSFVQERIENGRGLLRTSMRGVPHLIVDSEYSVCYFLSKKSFGIFAGYATPNNRKIKNIKHREEVVKFLNEII